MKLSDIKANPDNPRVIKDEAFNKLVQSIKDFPKMMALRPMVVDDNLTVLGGNMRLRALQHLGYKDIPDEWVKRASDLTEEEKKQFIIKDNVSVGDWDWDTLANEWDVQDLKDWGLDVWNFKQDAGMGGNFGGVSGGGYPEGISENGLKSGIVEELEGLDITPDDLPKISGEDNVLMERIIIVYPGERADEIAKLIGLESINKVVYSISELIGE